MKQESNTAIVLAAGQGKRMHSKIQKQFLEIDHRPVLYYSLECFQKSPLIQEIILVTGEEMISYCKREIVERYHFTKVTKVIAGGKERYDSGLRRLRLCIYTRRGKTVHNRRNPGERYLWSAGDRRLCSRHAIQRYHQDRR